MMDFRTLVAPTTHALEDIIELWERLLNVAPIHEHDDFFDLGGDSLLALQLLHEIERITGQALPITAIYDAATPALFAELLDSGAAPAFSPLVLLKTGVGEPLYIVHGIGGTIIELIKLGQLIDTSRPVYAIQAKGIDGDADPNQNVADMVEHYLEHVRARQPIGPYYLAGYSFGGLIAMDMARHLQADGDTVALLCVIDSYAHPQTFPSMARHLIRFGTAVHAFRTEPFADACRLVIERLKKRGAALPAAMILADTAEDGAAVTLREVHRAAFAALDAYRPRPYTGDVLFIRPKTSIFPIAPKRVWGRLLDSLTVLTVPGDHSSMVRVHVATLARAVSNALRQAAGDGEWK